MSILVNCSNDIYSVANKCKYARMEWNNNVHEKHVIAISYYLTWKYNNKPLAGICYDNMVNSRTNFKYELRRCKLISNQSESNKIALHLIKDRNNFWKVISNNLKKNNSSTPNKIENEHGIVNITKFWCNHFNSFNNLFKSTTDIPYPYNIINVNDIEYTNYAAISSIIKSIKGGKAISPDGISIEHISHANSFVIELIMLLINNLLRHSYFPKKLI